MVAWHRYDIIIHECKHTSNALIYALPASWTGRQVNVVCREMWGQIISFGSRDNMTPTFCNKLDQY